MFATGWCKSLLFQTRISRSNIIDNITHFKRRSVFVMYVQATKYCCLRSLQKNINDCLKIK